MVIIIILHVVFLSIVEGILWHLQAHTVFNFNKHILLVLLRYSWFLLLLPFVSIYKLLTLALFTMAIHPSIYYTTRNKIDNRIYPKKWFSEPSTVNSSIFNLRLWHRIVLLILSLLLSVVAYSQEIDFSTMTRSQIRQYRLLIENEAKVELNKERVFYAHQFKMLKTELEIEKARNKFVLDSLQEYRRLERLNYNKQFKILKEENKVMIDSLKRTNNSLIRQERIALKIKRNNTRYLYMIVILVVIVIGTIIYIINKLRNGK